MPQENTIILNDSTTIQYDPSQVPEGFEKLSVEEQKAYIRKGIDEYNANLEREKNATPMDILIPAFFVILFGIIIYFIAKKIRDNPKTYDKVVKLDGEPNPDHGKGWKDKTIDHGP